MNTLAIAPQLTMNVLQNMNIKRDTLEKRTSVKNPFHESSFSADCDTSTVPTTIAATGAATGAIPEYTPSIDEQYLPKSLRGANNNPYSIMNTMTESILSSSAQQQQQPPSTDINAMMELETSVAAAAASEIITEPQ